MFSLIITLNDLKSERFCGDVSVDLTDSDDPYFSERGYRRAIARIHKPLFSLEKLRRVKKQYEIYVFENDQCVVRGK
jgi:hypothetical protein